MSKTRGEGSNIAVAAMVTLSRSARCQKCWPALVRLRSSVFAVMVAFQPPDSELGRILCLWHACHLLSLVLLISLSSFAFIIDFVALLSLLYRPARTGLACKAELQLHPT
jgi:hypothetical protein